LKAALWKLPTDFEDLHSEDQSHQSLSLLCHLEANDFGDMKRYIVPPTSLLKLYWMFCQISSNRLCTCCCWLFC